MNKPTLADQLTGTLPIISSTARSAFVASHFILALGSGFAIMYLVLGAVGGNLPAWIGYALAWGGSLVWYRAVEDPLRKFILFAWAYRLTSKAERSELTANLRRVGRTSGWATALLLIVTLSLSLMINVDVAEAVTTEQDSTAEIEQAGTVTSSYDRDVELLREQVNEARTRDAVRVQKAQDQAKVWIAEAELSKGAKMRSLARSGNGWAKAQIAEPVRSATAKGEKHIAAIEAAVEAPALQSELTRYVSTRSASRDTVAAMTTQIVAGRRADYLTTKGRRNWLLFAAVCFVLAVFVWTARLLVAACLETGEDLEESQGPGIGEVAVKKVRKVSVWLGERLDSVGGDKFTVAPVGAALPHTGHSPAPPIPTPTPAAKPHSSVPPKSGVATSPTPIAATPLVPAKPTLATKPNPGASKSATPHTKRKGKSPGSHTDPHEIKRIDKRARTRFSRAYKYGQHGKTEQQQSAYADYLEDRDWLELAGQKVTEMESGKLNITTK